MQNSWLRQPSTITGLGAFGGVICAAVAHYLTGDTTIASGAGVIAFAAFHLVVDDNTAGAAVQTLVTEAVGAAVSGHLAERLPALINDGLAVAQALEKDRVPSAPAPSRGLSVAGLLLTGALALSACGPSPATTVAAVGEAAACLAPIAVGVVNELGSSDSDLRKGVITAEELAAGAASPACARAAVDAAKAVQKPEVVDPPPAAPAGGAATMKG